MAIHHLRRRAPVASLARWSGHPVGSRAARPTSREITSLSERYVALLALRVAIVGTVLLSSAVASRSLNLTVGTVAPLAGTYLAVAVVVELARRMAAARGLRAYRAMLLLDSLFILFLVVPSGGPRSALLAVFYVHLIAVTLLGSQRTGVRVALWDTILVCVVYGLGLGSDLGDHLGTLSLRQPSIGEVLFTVAGFWAVTACTGCFATLNEKELRRSKEDMSSLAAMANKLERTLRPEEVLSVLMETIDEAFDFERVIVWYNAPEGAHLLAGNGDKPTLAEGAERDGVVRRAWVEHEPVLVKRLDSEAEPVLAGLLPQAQNVAVIPLMADAEPLGVIVVERGGSLGIKLPLRTLRMLKQFAAHAALAMRNARLLNEVERLAKEDGLTGLANRREFETVLERELTRCKRTGNPLSLVVLDVDHFKRVNDTYGHPVGDDVLRAIAGALSGEARELDLVARYGGEEFAVILPDCSPADALGVTERMRASVRSLTMTPGVTVSAGIAAIPWNAEDGSGLVAAADEALYISKNKGRDRATGSTRRCGVVIETDTIETDAIETDTIVLGRDEADSGLILP
jgi:two-component system cell cycle response regulator